jgi:hypothetical protein
MKLLLIPILFVFSCTSKSEGTEVRADRIEMLFFNGGDTLRESSTSKDIFRNFNEVLMGKTYPTKCKPTGSVLFFLNDSVVNSASFSTDATGGDNDCQFLILNDKALKLTYNIGMYLDETFYSLKKYHE